METETKTPGKTVRVCMVAYTNYPFDARIRREAETLVANGFAVQCLTPRNGNSRSRFLVSGVEVVEVGGSKYRGKNPLVYLASYVGFLLHAFLKCTRASLKSEADVFHVHNMPNFLVFSALIPRLAGRKLILDIHDNMPEVFATKFSRWAGLAFSVLKLEERASAFLPHAIICVNHPQRDLLARHGIPAGKMSVSMNVPDPKLFPKITRAKTVDDHFRVVYHGTMARRLGVDLLLRAVALLTDRIPGLCLHLWGNGDDLESFQTLADELGIRERVEFKTQGVPLEELQHRLRPMDLGVIGNRPNSATEIMLPVKLLEYVSLGIPVVAPELKAIQYYFPPDSLDYYQPGDFHAMAEAILEVYKDPDRRLGQAARAQTILDRYCWEKQGGELVQLYRSLIER